MILPDVNVLIFAFRQDAPEHSLCSRWLASAVNGDSAFGISPLVLAAVVRVMTNRRTYARPSTITEAFSFCHALIGQPNCQLVESGARHFEIFRRLCVESNVHGADVTDAWYAALAIESGCEWITLDRDFARFPGLKWSAPAV
jgi:uncharacterized protein